MLPTNHTSAWALHHVGLTVADLERSIRFYRDVLGLILVGRRTVADEYVGQQTGFPGVRLAVASFRTSADSPHSFELVQYLKYQANVVEPATNRPGTAHLCFRVDDLRHIYERLLTQGVRFRSTPVTITNGPNRGGHVIYLYDPDGFTVELFEPSPIPANSSAPDPA